MVGCIKKKKNKKWSSGKGGGTLEKFGREGKFARYKKFQNLWKGFRGRGAGKNGDIVYFILLSFICLRLEIHTEFLIPLPQSGVYFL